MFPNRYEVMFTEHVYTMMRNKDTSHEVPKDSNDIDAWKEYFTSWYTDWVTRLSFDGLDINDVPIRESKNFLETIPVIWESWMRGFYHIYLYKSMNGPDIMKEVEELHKQFK